MIPFHETSWNHEELLAVQIALGAKEDRPAEAFVEFCRRHLQAHFSASICHLTPSCTDALEMSALLFGIGPGDEVIVPSFTFPSTANAFALRGATPVFVDVRADNFCLDQNAVAHALTERTRAVVSVRYGGARVDIEKLRHALPSHVRIIEDAAHACPLNEPEPLRADAIALSFHSTKHLSCGEGGALLVRDADYLSRAAILARKGTDYENFVRGVVDEYSWRGPGSSFTLSEVNAAVLAAQIRKSAQISRRLAELSDAYHERLAPLEERGWIERPPRDCRGRALMPHVYAVLLSPRFRRSNVIARLRDAGIDARSHYFPLHLSEGARRANGRITEPLQRTEDIAARILRLPHWAGLDTSAVGRVAEILERVLSTFCANDVGYILES